MIKAIIFDCFGVLTTDNWRLFLDTLPVELVEPARELNRQRDAGLIVESEFDLAIHELTGRLPHNVEQVGSAGMAKNRELLKVIQELSADYKIGLLSNISTNWIRDVFLTESEQAMFDDMVMSFEVGMTKPSPDIFKLVCGQLDVEPSQAILVDDIEDYVEAARAVGMRGVVYADLPSFRQSLTDLLDSNN